MNVLITGTTDGIGKEIAQDFYRKGCNVITLNRSQPNNQEWATNYQCDLSNLKEIEALELCIKNHNIDILINNAASGKPKIFKDFIQSEIEYEFSLNVFSPIYLIKIVLPNMINKNFGRIINISSISGVTPTPFLSVYSATKASMNSFTQSIAQEYKNNNISINAICPGGIETEMSVNGRKILSHLNGLPEDSYGKNMKQHIGMDKLIHPKRIFELIEFLAYSNDTSINGQVINLCGLLELH